MSIQLYPWLHITTQHQSTLYFRIEGYGFMNQCTHPKDSCVRRGKFARLLSRLADEFPNLRELDVSRTRVSWGRIMKLQRKLPNCEVITNPTIRV